MNKSLRVLVLALSFPVLRLAAQVPFAAEIAEFGRQDSLHMPARGGIVFTGSSSFRKWTDVNAYFPGYPIINRGFGGSSLPDLIHFLPQVVYRYHPKQVVIYCGDNDFMDKKVDGSMVFERVKTLLTEIRSHVPAALIVYLSIKPSPSRFYLMSEVTKANGMIRNYMSNQHNMKFVDVFRPMMRNGRPIPEIFESDSLHMNAKGYRIWQAVMKPYLAR